MAGSVEDDHLLALRLKRCTDNACQTGPHHPLMGAAEMARPVWTGALDEALVQLRGVEGPSVRPSVRRAPLPCLRT